MMGMSEKPSRERVEKMVEELAREPGLFERMEALMKEVRAEQGGSLDRAEGAVVEGVRGLGREAMEVWLREAAGRQEAPAKARKGAKKNSAS